jgi:hypothetical protein
MGQPQRSPNGLISPAEFEQRAAEKQRADQERLQREQEAANREASRKGAIIAQTCLARALSQGTKSACIYEHENLSWRYNLCKADFEAAKIHLAEAGWKASYRRIRWYNSWFYTLFCNTKIESPPYYGPEGIWRVKLKHDGTANAPVGG